MLRNLKKRGFFKHVAKAFAFVIILVLVFSPFQQIFIAPEVNAAGGPGGGLGIGLNQDSTGQYTGLNTSTSTPPTDAACDSIGSCLAYVVYIFTAGLGSGAAYVGAWFFNIAVHASLQSVAYALNFISISWTQVRDLANMAFIFILIYIAFMIMLKAEVSGTMQMLAKVVAVALIINFSFFLTRLVIDGGNVLAVQFYNAATQGAPTIGNTATGATAAVTNVVRTGQVVTNTFGLTNDADIYATKDLTAGIMSAINVQGILSSDSLIALRSNSSALTGWATEAITLSFIYLAVGIILFILAGIFLSVGIKFIIRIVILWLVIIASPLALVMKTMKQTEKYYNMWQNALVTQAFYPAVFLFLFIIITGFAYAVSGCSPGQTNCQGIAASIVGSVATLDQNASGFATIAVIIANVAIKLGFLVVLLIIALKISDKVSSYGGQVAHSINGWASRGATGAVFGTAGALGRNTLGWAGNAAYRSNGLRNFAARNAVVGRTLWRGAGALGRAGYDARGVPGVKTGLGKIGIETRDPRGKGGYAAGFDARIKMREEESKKLKPSESKLDAAYKKSVSGLSEADRDELAKKAKNLAEKQQQFKDGLADRDEVKTANAEFKKIVERTKVVENAKKIAGADNAKKYAEAISKKGWGNLAGATGHFPAPGWISAADLEAAAKIRDSKNDSERIKNLFSPKSDTHGSGYTPPSTGSGRPPDDDKPRGGGSGSRRGRGDTSSSASPAPESGSHGATGVRGDDTTAMLSKLVKLAERSAKTNEKIATALTAQTHLPPTNDNRKFEKSVEKKLENIEETVNGANDNIKPEEKKKAA